MVLRRAQGSNTRVTYTHTQAPTPPPMRLDLRQITQHVQLGQVQVRQPVDAAGADRAGGRREAAGSRAWADGGRAWVAGGRRDGRCRRARARVDTAEPMQPLRSAPGSRPARPPASSGAAPRGVGEGDHVEPADAAGAPRGGAVLGANLAQLVWSGRKESGKRSKADVRLLTWQRRCARRRPRTARLLRAGRQAVAALVRAAAGDRSRRLAAGDRSDRSAPASSPKISVG